MAADEVIQRTAVVALRGFGSLRDRGLFLAWVQRIVRNEWNDLLTERHRRAEVALSDGLSVAEPPAVEGPHWTNWLGEATRDAIAVNLLSDFESRLLLARIEDPRATWDELGTLFGRRGGTLAVAHGRARDRLRVFLFLHRVDFLGGSRLVAEAFDEAIEDATPPPFDREEAATFRDLIVLRRRDRPPGWYERLNAACRRVIRFLPLPTGL